MRKYRIEIEGKRPLIFHHDDIEWADQMDEWRLDKDNAKNSKAGDDRFPAYRWLGCFYRNDAGQIIIPTANIMRAVMDSAADVPVPGARNSRKTFKSQSQSGILPDEIGWPLHINGNGSPLLWEPIEKLIKVPKFADHSKLVKKMGFELFIKRVKIGTARHVRVRPRFQKWAAAGTLTVTDEAITKDILTTFFEIAGTYKGLGDWRPGSKTPGSYGMFTAKVTEAR